MTEESTRKERGRGGREGRMGGGREAGGQQAVRKVGCGGSWLQS